ncbi:MAG: J domain-containing protein [Pirellulales bacterium]|nr:J domain-containing protein [Pirellulales bacterium]
MMGDYYRILGVGVEATRAEIEHAYREQVRKHHPDLHPDDARARRRFQQIQAAFDALSDPFRRQMYDLGRRGPRYEPAGRRPNSDSRDAGADAALEDDLDALRFVRRPGTAVIPYRRRGRWESLADWLRGDDFLLPLALGAPFLAVHFLWLAMEVVRTVWH